jgi:DeoR/GlpR family transcriptional regulator of sugar metabolism
VIEVNLDLLDKENGVLDIDELSECIGRSSSTIRRITERGELTPIKWNHRLYYKTDDVRQYLKDCEVYDVVHQKRINTDTHDQ